MKVSRSLTLIELLVSVTIILMLVVATGPAYEKIQNRNQLRAAAEKLQNCISEAKAQALAPSTEDQGLLYYSATLYDDSDPITQSSKPNKNTCQIYKKISPISSPSVFVSKYNLSTNIYIVPFKDIDPDGHSNTSYHEYVFENAKKGASTRYEEDPDNLGYSKSFSTQKDLTTIILRDDRNNCIKLSFVYETGEMLIESSGKFSSGQPPQCLR